MLEASGSNFGPPHKAYRNFEPLLVVGPPSAIGRLLPFEMLLRLLRLLLACGEDSLLAAADTFVSVQSLQNELCCGYLDFGAVLATDAQWRELIHESLDAFQPVQHIFRAGGIR